MTIHRFIIGIDPGTNTGLAIWDRQTNDFYFVGTLQIHDALHYIRVKHDYDYFQKNCLIRCENPNTWRPFGKQDKSDRSKLQGAGSVKRDFAIWQDFAKGIGIPFESVNLQSSMKKLKAERFEQITGYNKRTSEHARDAAMLCFKY